MRNAAKTATGCGLLLLGAALIPDFWVWNQGRKHLLDSPSQIQAQLVVVPGASVYRDGRLSPILKERVDAALAALRAWPQARILLSGTAIPGGYDEVNAMRRYALERGIDSARILVDHHGESSQETIAGIFRLRLPPGEVVLVSQSWHLPRCLWLGRSQDIKGIACDRPSGSTGWLPRLREHPARIQNFWAQTLRGS